MGITKPKIGIVICTLNCRGDLKICLESIKKQDYPSENVRVYIADSDSDDGTVELAKQEGCTVIEHIKRGYMEGKGFAKSIGVDLALENGCDYIFTIDSDNAFVETDFITKMISPMVSNPEVALSIARMAIVKSDKAINRYCSYVGTDSFAIYKSIDPKITFGEVEGETYLGHSGLYDLYNLTLDNYLVVGGYYVCFRRKTLESIGGYWRDVDNIWKLAEKNMANVAVPHNCHIHHRQAKGLWNHLKKKYKWAKHYVLEGSPDKDKERKFDWMADKDEFYLRVIYCLAFFPALFTSFKMMFKHRDLAWLYHAPMCFGTTTAYIAAWINSKFRKI